MNGLAAGALELGEVVGVDDPEALNRVEVRFLSRGPASGTAGNTDGQDATAWALVTTGFAGNGSGAFLLPDVGTRVVLACLNGDSRYPVVLGAVWDGAMESPETLGGDGRAVDRWSFTGKAGTRIAMVEEAGNSVIEIETVAGNRMVIDDNDGSLEIVQGTNRITLDQAGIRIESTNVEISTTSFSLTASTASFQTPLADFSAFVMCELLQTNSVVSPSYTPGAGNML